MKHDLLLRSYKMLPLVLGLKLKKIDLEAKFCSSKSDGRSIG